MQLDRGSLIILSTMGLDLSGSGQVFAALPHLLPDMTGLIDIRVDTVCLRAGSRRPEPTSDPAFLLLAPQFMTPFHVGVIPARRSDRYPFSPEMSATNALIAIQAASVDLWTGWPVSRFALPYGRSALVRYALAREMSG